MTTSIDDMCKILDKHLIKSEEYTDCAILYRVTFDQLRNLYDAGIAASAQQAPMVDMGPPATSRDRWMYEQGRLAERDPRTHEREAPHD